jgi:hypothetical protein
MSAFTFDFDLEDDLDESFDAIPPKPSVPPINTVPAPEGTEQPATLVHDHLTILLPRGAMAAIFTNPMWVTNVQTFTAPPNSPTVHLGLGSASLVYFDFIIL